MEKKNTTPETVKVIDLSMFVKPSKSKKEKGESDREKSAYSLLTIPATPVREFMASPVSVQPCHHVYLEEEKVFVVSPSENIKYAPVEVLQAIVKEGHPDVKVMSGNIVNTIHELFYSPTSPKTKCHDYWFGIDNEGSPVFCALQGNGIKISRM